MVPGRLQPAQRVQPARFGQPALLRQVLAASARAGGSKPEGSAPVPRTGSRRSTRWMSMAAAVGPAVSVPWLLAGEGPVQVVGSRVSVDREPWQQKSGSQKSGWLGVLESCRSQRRWRQASGAAACPVSSPNSGPLPALRRVSWSASAPPAAVVERPMTASNRWAPARPDRWPAVVEGILTTLVPQVERSECGPCQLAGRAHNRRAAAGLIGFAPDKMGETSGVCLSWVSLARHVPRASGWYRGSQCACW